MYIDSEKTTPVDKANQLETDGDPQMHLSASDGEMVSDATQMVFHKMEDGTLFCEVFPNKAISEKYIGYFIFTFSDEARKKLRSFLNTPVTY